MRIPFTTAVISCTAGAALAACGHARRDSTPADHTAATAARCPPVLEAHELFRAPGRDAAATRSTAPDTIAWNNALFLAYHMPVQVTGTETPGFRRIVRIGFIERSAIFAEPADAFDPEAIFWLQPESCTVQEYQRMQCTAQSMPAISVRGVDMRTGAPVPNGYRVTARDGSYSDTDSVAGYREWQTTGSKERGVEVAYDRPGTYDVEIDARGYHPWKVGNIPVLPGRCHVRTVLLVAHLVPLSR